MDAWVSRSYSLSREVNCQTRHRADCKDGSELNGFINLDWLTAHPFHPPRRRAQRKDRMKEKKDFASVDLLFGRSLLHGGTDR